MLTERALSHNRRASPEGPAAYPLYMRPGVLHRRCAFLSVSPQRWIGWRNPRYAPRFPRSTGMTRGKGVSEELPDAVNGWRVEALKLHKQRGWNYYRAHNHVLVRYLVGGDARPLLDLIVNMKRQPRRRAGEFIAAITDSATLIDRIDWLPDLPTIDMRRRFRHCSPKFEIRISERRGRGHPQAGPDNTGKSEIWLELLRGFIALATDKWPLEQFWRHLAIALSFNEGRCLDQTFPVEAKLVRTDGRSGRRRDPELQVRDQVFHAAVHEKMAAGSKYEFAIIERLRTWRPCARPKVGRKSSGPRSSKTPTIG